jgi:hypothetical protein
MAEDKVDLRDVNWRQLFGWLDIFRGFQIALDVKKLLLAAAGIVVMALGWWVLALIFINSAKKPEWSDYRTSDKYRAKDATDEEAREAAWLAFKEDRRQWDLLYKAAGPADAPEKTDAGDLADRYQQYDPIQNKIAEGATEFTIDGVPYKVRTKPAGKLRTWPWSEDRGPNPFLLVTGQAGNPAEQGSAHYGPWERGRFLEWFVTDQVPVLIEPLVKFLEPVVYFLSPHAGFRERFYFFLVILWTLATWALFGGAITRMVAVQVARKEKIDLMEALRFAGSHYLSYFLAPVFPLLFVLAIVVLMILFGALHLIPAFGDIFVDGLLWPLPLLGALVMAILLVGLVGWPLMSATISAEGSDSFDALSRSYSYVYQAPWHYIWYCFLALVYGAVLVFFVGFMGSLVVYLSKWGVSQTPLVQYFHRDPSYLFVFAPESFDWRRLLLEGSPAVTSSGAVNTEPLMRGFHVWNWVGAALVAAWLYLVFLMVLGFGYSYFWTASTIIYLLMRRKVEDTELDEVYLEEDESEETYGTSAPAAAPAPAPAPAAAGPTLTMVESPSLKPSTPPPSPSPAYPPARTESAPTGRADGNPPPAGET